MPRPRSRPAREGSQETLEQRAPPGAEDLLARLRAVGAQAALADAPRDLRLIGESPDGGGERGWIARRNEQCAFTVRQQLACRLRVGGDDRSAARERLEDLVRDHPGRLRGAAEGAEGAAGTVILAREQLVRNPGHPLDVRRWAVEQPRLLAAADDAEADLGQEPRGRDDRLEPVEGDQLADEEAGERCLGSPA